MNLLSYIPDILLIDIIKLQYRTFSWIGASILNLTILDTVIVLYFKWYSSCHVRNRSNIAHWVYFGGKGRKAIGNSWPNSTCYFTFPCRFCKNLFRTAVHALASLCNCRLIENPCLWIFFWNITEFQIINFCIRTVKCCSEHDDCRWIQTNRLVI